MDWQYMDWQYDTKQNYNKWHIYTLYSTLKYSYILIKELLTDSPLLIIKENINCGNFLNNDRFNFLIDRINCNSLTNFPINERLYNEALFHILLQNERYSMVYKTNKIIIDLVSILNSSHSDTNRLYHDTTTTQQEHRSVQRKVCFYYKCFSWSSYKTFWKDFTRGYWHKSF